MRRWGSVLAAAGAGAALGGCGASSPQTIAAHKIADALPRAIGPAAHYDVRVEGDSLALTRGRARRVVITGQDVQVSPRVVLDGLTLDAQDVSFDTGQRRPEHVGQAAFMATMGQIHLNQYLSQSKPLLPGLVVTLRPRDVEARVPVALASLHTVATLTGTLAPDTAAPQAVDFVADRTRIGILPLPTSLVNLALREVNPVLDLSSLRVPVTVERAGVVNSQIVLEGSARLGAASPTVASTFQTRR